LPLGISHVQIIRAITVAIAHDLVVAIDKATSGIAMAAQETTVTVADGVLVVIVTFRFPLSLIIGYVAILPERQNTCVGLDVVFTVEIGTEGAVGATFLLLACGTAVVGVGPVVVVDVVEALLDCKGTHIIDWLTGKGVLAD
jgi:hypothetical protein